MARTENGTELEVEVSQDTEASYRRAMNNVYDAISPETLRRCQEITGVVILGDGRKGYDVTLPPVTGHGMGLSGNNRGWGNESRRLFRGARRRNRQSNEVLELNE